MDEFFGNGCAAQNITKLRPDTLEKNCRFVGTSLAITNCSRYAMPIITPNNVVKQNAR